MKTNARSSVLLLGDEALSLYLNSYESWGIHQLSKKMSSTNCLLLIDPPDKRKQEGINVAHSIVLFRRESYKRFEEITNSLSKQSFYLYLCTLLTFDLQ